MIITLKSGDVITINEKFEPKVAAGGSQESLLDCAKRIKLYCRETRCEECVFESDNDRFPCTCKISGSMPDDWEV